MFLEICQLKNKKEKEGQTELPPFDGRRGSHSTKDEDMAKVLNAFLASVFNSQISCFLGTQPRVSKDRTQEHNETPMMQEGRVRNLLCHLDTQ